MNKRTTEELIDQILERQEAILARDKDVMNLGAFRSAHFQLQECFEALAYLIDLWETSARERIDRAEHEQDRTMLAPVLIEHLSIVKKPPNGIRFCVHCRAERRCSVARRPW
jgi:hypothetical protein